MFKLWNASKSKRCAKLLAKQNENSLTEKENNELVDLLHAFDKATSPRFQLRQQHDIANRLVFA